MIQAWRAMRRAEAVSQDEIIYTKVHVAQRTNALSDAQSDSLRT